jgi:hypothetical protein
MTAAIEETSAGLATMRRFNAALAAAADRILQTAGPQKAVGYWLDKDRKAYPFGLVQGRWVSSPQFPAMRMMLVDEDIHCGGCPASQCSASCSRVLVQADALVCLPPHHHDNCETVHVIEGEYFDPLTQVSARRSADKIYIPAKQQHAPEIRGLFLVCWSPPLQPAVEA